MASIFKDQGNKAFEEGKYREAAGLYTRGLSRDPTFIKLWTNRALTYYKLELWEECLDDCLKAIELSPGSFKAYFYLAQAQLQLRHPNEALSSALTAYQIGLKTADQSTPKACELVLNAKRIKWEVKEKMRLRQRSELLCELEDSIQRRAFDQSNETIDPAEIAEIEESARAKIEELYSIFAMADPSMQRREVPDYMIDQISFAFMHDPVLTKAGHSYERHTIEAHLKESETDPLTREPLYKTDLRPNLALKQACAEFLEKNGWAVDW